MESFERLPEEEKTRCVDERYALLKDLEQEYDWTQNPDTKERMMSLAHWINNMLLSTLNSKK